MYTSEFNYHVSPNSLDPCTLDTWQEMKHRLVMIMEATLERLQNSWMDAQGATTLTSKEYMEKLPCYEDVLNFKTAVTTTAATAAGIAISTTAATAAGIAISTVVVGRGRFILPLIGDVSGDGLEQLLGGSQVSVRHDADDFAKKARWVSPKVGFLDRDGHLNRFPEVFATAITNEFEELAALDSNADRTIDAQNAQEYEDSAPDSLIGSCEVERRFRKVTSMSPNFKLCFATTVSLPLLLALVHSMIAPRVVLNNGDFDHLYFLGWQQYDDGDIDTALGTFQSLLTAAQQSQIFNRVQCALNAIGFICLDCDASCSSYDHNRCLFSKDNPMPHIVINSGVTERGNASLRNQLIWKLKDSINHDFIDNYSKLIETFGFICAHRDRLRGYGDDDPRENDARFRSSFHSSIGLTLKRFDSQDYIVNNCRSRTETLSKWGRFKHQVTYWTTGDSQNKDVCVLIELGHLLDNSYFQETSNKLEIDVPVSPSHQNRESKNDYLGWFFVSSKHHSADQDIDGKVKDKTIYWVTLSLAEMNNMYQRFVDKLNKRTMKLLIALLSQVKPRLPSIQYAA